MTKKALNEIVTSVVSQVAKAHDVDEESARTLLGVAVKRNADLLVVATSPPAKKTEALVLDSAS